jgi:hypothetical protein
MKTFKQFQEEAFDSPPRWTGDVIRDYPLTPKQKEVIKNSPLPYLRKSQGYSTRQNVQTDVPMPDSVRPEKTPDDGMHDNQGDNTYLPYNKKFEEPVKHPIIDVKGQDNIDYKEYQAPSEYDRHDPTQNTIFTKKQVKKPSIA